MTFLVTKLLLHLEYRSHWRPKFLKEFGKSILLCSTIPHFLIWTFKSLHYSYGTSWCHFIFFFGTIISFTISLALMFLLLDARSSKAILWSSRGVENQMWHLNQYLVMSFGYQYLVFQMKIQFKDSDISRGFPKNVYRFHPSWEILE